MTHLTKIYVNVYNKIMEDFTEKINIIKESILKNTTAKYIYLFGSYAYGKPTNISDIDIYLVLPDDTSNLLEIYGRIMVDLGIKKIFFVDLVLIRESEFNIRRNEHLLERTVYQKGKMIYGY
jgi:predicted nucleotidyltransferase